MIVCPTLAMAAWTPDFSSSGQASPVWTRVSFDRMQLINGLEAVEWDDRDRNVQVEICEQCGYTHCERGGYVRMTRLGDAVLWSPPRLELETDWITDVDRRRYSASRAVDQHGAVVITADAWDGLRDRCAELPALSSLEPTIRADLEAAWLVPARRGRPFDPTDEASLRNEVIASHRPDVDAAVAHVAWLARWFRAAADATIDTGLVPVDPGDPALVTLYLDAPERAWPALYLGQGRRSPAFPGAWTLGPAPGAIGVS
jgi:hypothetical protein